MKKLPKKFEMCINNYPSNKFVLTQCGSDGKYSCEARTCLEDAFNLPAVYSQQFVQEAINCGNWIITKDLDEPELVFPIIAKHRDDAVTYPSRYLVITKSADPSFVDVIWHENTGTGLKKEDIAFWTIKDCKRLVKEGKWIVKRVGEKPQEPRRKVLVTRMVAENAWPSTTAYDALIEAGYGEPVKGDQVLLATKDGKSQVLEFDGYIWYKAFLDSSVLVDCGFTGTTIKAKNLNIPGKVVDAKLTITADTDAAVEAVERLRQAYEDLAIAMESVIALTEEMKNV
jgi:hypothetical protein